MSQESVLPTKGFYDLMDRVAAIEDTWQSNDEMPLDWVFSQERIASLNQNYPLYNATAVHSLRNTIVENIRDPYPKYKPTAIVAYFHDKASGSLFPILRIGHNTKSRAQYVMIDDSNIAYNVVVTSAGDA